MSDRSIDTGEVDRSGYRFGGFEIPPISDMVRSVVPDLFLGSALDRVAALEARKAEENRRVAEFLRTIPGALPEVEEVTAESA